MENKIVKKINVVEEKIKFQKENGCKILDCKVIDRNIKLQQENIKLKQDLKEYKKIAERLAYLKCGENIWRNSETGEVVCGGSLYGKKCKKFSGQDKCAQCVVNGLKKGLLHIK